MSSTRVSFHLRSIMRNIPSDKMHGKDEKKEAFQNTRKFKIQIHEVFNTALCYYRT